MINLTQIRYSYTSEMEGFALGSLDLRLEAGKVYGWRGHNGSGKSTLASILVGEKQQQSGTVSGLPERSFLFAQRIAENIFPELTVAQHFKLFGNSSNRNRVEQTFPELIKRFDNYPDELSGGELQRLAFSMAFLKDFQLYIFDEVTNHLDDAAKRIVGSMIRDWVSGDYGRYAVFISHDKEFQKSFCDEVIEFEEGKIRKLDG